MDEYFEDNSEDSLWQKKVGANGDLFYLEADNSSQYVPTVPYQRHPYNGKVIDTAIPSNLCVNGLSNHVKESESSSKTKSIKSRVKGLLSNSSKTSLKAEVKLTNSELNKHNLNSSSHVVTFNDVPTGVMKDVTIFVDPFRHNYGRRATQLENLFGIIPGHFGSPSHDSGDKVKDRRIMVQGLIPNAEAMKASVKIGEWLMCVNDLEVTFDNIDSILSGITGPRFIKLTLQKIAIQTSPKQLLVKKKHVNEELVKLVSGERLHLNLKSCENFTHGLMFLSLECKSNSMQERDDILYQYPCEDNDLVVVRGLFITMTQMMLDVTNNVARNTTIVVNEKLIYVGYYKENREVLVMCLPANKVSMVQLNEMLQDVVRLIKLLFGSLHSAFTNKQNHVKLNHFCTLLFYKTLLGQQIFQNGHKLNVEMSCSFHKHLPAVRMLTLPEEIKIVINNCLSTLEASEFADMSDDYYDLRRLYTIVGSCVFYRGYLLASHLHKEDLFDIYLYLHHYCVLGLNSDEQLGHVILWKEVFPTRRCHKQVDPVLPGFAEPEARWFYMVVGMKNLLLGVLLEAGGCSAWAIGNPGPDPFYMDQAKATILQLESLDVVNHCEVRLHSPSVPSLTSIDAIFASQQKSQKSVKENQNTSPRQLPISKKRSTKEPESILKKTGDVKKGRGLVYDMDSDVDSHSTNSDNSIPLFNRFFSSQISDDSGGSGSSGFFKENKKRRNLMYAYDMETLKRAIDGDAGSLVKKCNNSDVRIVSGHSNTLFQYVHMDSIDGIFICPSQQELSELKGKLNKQLLYNFQQACISIRSILQQSRKREEWIKNGSLGKFGIDESLGIVREHGILFECNSPVTDGKKSQSNTYWVIGRVFDEPYPREVYVCFLNTIQQNCIEMAFKLGFGLGML